METTFAKIFSKTNVKNVPQDIDIQTVESISSVTLVSNQQSQDEYSLAIAPNSTYSAISMSQVFKNT